MIYLPLKYKQKMTKINDWSPKETLKSRYANKMIDGRYYYTINIPKQKEIKRIYSDIDPFGEENWEE